MAQETAASGERTRRTHGERTRKEILDAAVELARVEGLEGLTIGTLAEKVGMSKGGLFAHFGSKDALQLATLDAALEIFINEVVVPAQEAPPGLERMRALSQSYLAYVERRGCFLTAAAVEFDDRPGPIRDRLQSVIEARAALVREAVEEAIRAGELRPDVDTEQLAFEVVALTVGANVEYQLSKNPMVLERVRKGLAAKLAAIAVPAKGQAARAARRAK